MLLSNCCWLLQIDARGLHTYYVSNSGKPKSGRQWKLLIGECRFSIKHREMVYHLMSSYCPNNMAPIFKCINRTKCSIVSSIPTWVACRNCLHNVLQCRAYSVTAINHRLQNFWLFGNCHPDTGVQYIVHRQNTWFSAADWSLNRSFRFKCIFRSPVTLSLPECRSTL